MSVANNLAKDNGISVNHNNNKSKGANTLSGKSKELKRIGLRSAEINAFDIGTSIKRIRSDSGYLFGNNQFCQLGSIYIERSCIV